MAFIGLDSNTARGLFSPLCQFLPSSEEESIIRELLDAEEVLIEDEDEPIPELPVMPPGNVQLAATYAYLI